MKFEDSMISIDRIIERIKKGKFRVAEAVEVPVSDDIPEAAESEE